LHPQQIFRPEHINSNTAARRVFHMLLGRMSSFEKVNKSADPKSPKVVD